jgi:hypothetical protein
VKSWLWKNSLAIVACSLIVAGMAPAIDLFTWSKAHNLFPARMPLPLKRGEYTSTFFKADLDETYEIQIGTVDYPAQIAQMDLDWKIVDNRGTILKQGTYSDLIDSGDRTIGEYQPKAGLQQRVIVQIKNVLKGADAAHPQLIIGLPQRSDDFYNVRDVFNVWAVITAVSGALLLIFWLIRRMKLLEPGIQLTL